MRRIIFAAYLTISACVTNISFSDEVDASIQGNVLAAEGLIVDISELPIMAKPGGALSIGGASLQIDSPNGSQMAFIIRHGSVDGEYTEDHLYVLNEELVEDLFQQSNTLVNLHAPIAKFQSTTNAEAIRSLRWLNDDMLAFIGETPTEKSQVFTLNVDTRELVKRTSHTTAVRSFSISKDLSTVVYTANVDLEVYHERKRQEGYNVTFEKFHDIIGVGHSTALPHSEYFVDTDGQPLKRLDTPVRDNMATPTISISPDAKHAVISTRSLTVSADWLNFDFGPLQRLINNLRTGDWPTPWARSYALADLDTGRVSTLHDGLIGMVGSSETIWSRDSNHFVLSNVYVAAGRASRDSNRAQIVRYHVQSPERGQTIAEVPRVETAGRLKSIRFGDSEDTLQIVSENESFIAKQNARDLSWEISEPVAATSTPSRSDPLSIGRFTLKLEESMSQLPVLLLRDNFEGRSATICDFSCPYSVIGFQPAEVFAWEDDLGKEWKGGLLIPQGENRGPLPLIIQTHGFSEEEFLITGPDDVAAGFSAQVFVKNGFAVLQIGEDYSVIGKENEAERHVEAYRTAIAKLADQGVIDPDRVGIIGWSRTGFYVHSALVRYPSMFKATNIVDASGFSIGYYFLMLNYPHHFRRDIMFHNGGPPYGDTIRNWVERDPAINADKITAAVRVEQYSRGISPWWSTYVVLRELERPTTFFHLPNSAHAPVQPIHKYISQKESLTWFERWLKHDHSSEVSTGPGSLQNRVSLSKQTGPPL